MKKNTFRNGILLIMVGLGFFMYFDPLKPTDDEAKSAILTALVSDGEVSSVDVGRSFTGRRVEDGFQTRLWPASANVTERSRQLPDHQFLLWKDERGRWTAELQDPQTEKWDHLGYYGVGRFGM